MELCDQTLLIIRNTGQSLLPDVTLTFSLSPAGFLNFFWPIKSQNPKEVSFFLLFWLFLWLVIHFISPTQQQHISLCEHRLLNHVWLYGLGKAALFKFFLSTVDQMTACHVKGVVHSDKSAETLFQFLSSINSTEGFNIFQIIVFGLRACNFTVSVHSHCSRSIWPQEAAFFQQIKL